MKKYSMAKMGGYSIVVLGLVLLGLSDDWVVPLGILMMVLANFLNHPHFMASYKIFFEIYPKIKNGDFEKKFETRWWIAAVVVPLILMTLLTVGVIRSLRGDDSIFNVAVLIYGISVGWHYVKQGFGMAMSEASFKKCYWPLFARRWMLWNSYACWIFSMCFLFSAEGGVSFLGWKFSMGQTLLEKLLFPTSFFLLITSLGVSVSIFRSVNSWKCLGKNRKDWPVAGLLGYLTSLYVWVLAGVAFPILMLIIPFFHSMQYMHVVERIYDRKDRRVEVVSEKTKRWLALIIFGFLFFWLIPGVFDYIFFYKVNYTLPSGMLITAAFWLFINIHHYFIDNVIWRRENSYVWSKLNA